MSMTPAQSHAVNSHGRPLFIQAGAGTGKTFTLAKRIATGIARGDIPGVDALATITFTNKAAAELVGRVRLELRSEGLTDEALAVDSAWVSTIHGMCYRMLATHAFDVGMDPGAGLLDDMATDALFAQALDEVLASRAADPQIVLLQDVFGGTTGMCRAVTATAGLFETVESGAASIDTGPAPVDTPEGIAAQLLELWTDTARDLLECSFADAGDSAASYCASVDDRIARLSALLAPQAPAAPASPGTPGTPGTSAAPAPHDTPGTPAAPAPHDTPGTPAAPGTPAPEEPLDWRALHALLGEVGSFAHGRCKRQPGRDILDAACDAADALVARVTAALSHEVTVALVDLADAAYARHSALKASRGVADIGDILTTTLRLLDDNPRIADAYRSRFASVMVDEFQDTDRLQVAIIRHITDEGLSTLATVGDAQQSIYGFRGADLEVYREMRDLMRERGADEVALDVNFRSHPGILEFVEAVFSSPAFFADDFLHVSPGPANARDLPWIAAGDPRVELCLVAGTADADGKFPLSEHLVAAEADVIADEFASLHARGADWGEMAVLLRRMGNADVYRRALESRGIPVVVSGGSLFYTSDEVATLVCLLRFLRNPDDDEATLALLAGGMFDVSDDLLVALADLRADAGLVDRHGLRSRASLHDALAVLAAESPAADTPDPAADILAPQGLRDSAGSREARDFPDPPAPASLAAPDPADVAAQAAFVLHTLDDALDAAASTPLAVVVRRTVRASGWWDTLATRGAAGSAVAANTDRFCDLVDEVESRIGHSPVRVAEHFRQIVDLAASGALAGGSPATMASEGTGAVQIMTFHASKGLEFPIVAVAEYDRKSTSSSGVKSLSEDGVVHLAWTPPKKDPGGPIIVGGDDPAGSFARATTPLAYTSHAACLARSRDGAEAQRLLYVALTRARDRLIVCGHDARAAADPDADPFDALGDTLFASLSRAALAKLPDIPRRLVRITRQPRDASGAPGDAASPDAAAPHGDVALSDAEPHGDAASPDAVASLDAAAPLGGIPPASPTPDASPTPSDDTSAPRIHCMPRHLHAAPISADPSPASPALQSYSSLARARALAAEQSPASDVPPASPPAAHAEPALAEPADVSDADSAHATDAGESPDASATDFGSAFHQVAQWLAAHPAPDTPGTPGTPYAVALAGRTEAAARRWALSPAQRTRLADVVGEWQNSRLYATACAFPQCFAEHAFFVRVADVPLEGFIDLLCIDAARHTALVVDYKTGTGDEDASVLRARYRLQAQCYAFAVLSTGTADHVDVVFVRPECGMTEVRFSWDAADLDALRTDILS